MASIAERISSTLQGIECPGCMKRVVPTFLEGGEGEEQVPPPDGRWSFVWRPTSGLVCPECKFPLGRYAQRLKWVRLLGLGIASATAAVLLWVVGMMGGAGDALRMMQRILGGFGALAIVLGGLGIILGGRRRA